MSLRLVVSMLLSSFAAILFLNFCPAAMAQSGGQPQVSVVNLKVVQNANGTQSVVTPKGDLAPLPGAGVNGSVAPIYIGANGGFWYVDKNGQNVDLHNAVQQLMARRSQQANAAQVPQYAPAYAQPQQQQQTQSSGGSSAATTALAATAGAGLGMMAGSAMTHAFYDVPYGTPMYYGSGGNPYYYNNGERQELTPNQQAVAYNKYNQNQAQKQQQQQALQQAQSNNQARYNQRQTNVQSRQQAYANRNQSNMQSGLGNQQAHSHFQNQQQWYQNQLSQNSGRANKWKSQTHNPFVNQQHQGRFSGANRGSRLEGLRGGQGGSRLEGLRGGQRNRPTRSRGGRGRFGR